jgi:serine/threonine protein kinase
MRYCRACRRHLPDDRRVCARDGAALQPLPERPPEVGEWLDNRYSLDALLAVGGTSHVFQAYDLERDEVCAVKVLKPELAAIPTVVRHFFDEGLLSRAVRHPGVLPVRDFALSDTGRFYLVMELVKAERLDTMITRRGRLLYDEAIVLARDVLSILHAVHAAGLVHLDVKPENVFVARDRLVLYDFGSALRVEARPPAATPLYGTPEYMAPEWILHRDARPASDLYALGVTLFEVLTGTVPYAAEDPVEVLRQQVHAPFPFERLRLALPPSFRGRFQWFVSALVEKDPERRLASAVDALQLLEDNLVVAPQPIRLVHPAPVDEAPSERSLLAYDEPRAPNASSEEVVLVHVDLAASSPEAARAALEPCFDGWKGFLDDAGARVVFDSGSTVRVLYGWGVPPRPERVLEHVHALLGAVRSLQQRGGVPPCELKVGVAMGRVHYDPEWEMGPASALEGASVAIAERLASLVPGSGVSVNRRFHDHLTGAVRAELLALIPVRERLEREEVYLLAA